MLYIVIINCIHELLIIFKVLHIFLAVYGTLIKDKILIKLRYKNIKIKDIMVIVMLFYINVYLYIYLLF